MNVQSNFMLFIENKLSKYILLTIIVDYIDLEWNKWYKPQYVVYQISGGRGRQKY